MVSFVWDRGPRGTNDEYRHPWTRSHPAHMGHATSDRETADRPRACVEADGFHRVRESAWNETGIETMREKRRRKQETRLRENGFWLRLLMDAANGDEDAATLLDLDARLAELSGEAIRDLADQVLDKRRYVEAIQRP